MQLLKLACSSFLRLSSSQEFRSACSSSIPLALNVKEWYYCANVFVCKIKDLRRRERVVSLSKMNRLLFVSLIMVLDIVSSRYGKYEATSNVPEDMNGEPERTQDIVKVVPMPSLNIGQLFRLLKSFKDKTLFNRMFKTDENMGSRMGRITVIPNWG